MTNLDAGRLPPAAAVGRRHDCGETLMARYLARRLAFGVFLVFAVSSATLLLASAAPGDYVTESLGASVKAETAARARVRYGLDQTILRAIRRMADAGRAI